MKIKFIVLLIFIFSGITYSCSEKFTLENQGVIKNIQNKEAAIKAFDTSYFLYFEDGIEVDSPNLLDTIYLLRPVNLSDNYKTDSLQVKASGDILENPGYSSHNNYTEFQISAITEN